MRHRTSLLSVAGAALACFLVVLVAEHVELDHQSLLGLMAIAGSTALVVFATPEARTARPRNVLVAHVVGGLIGVAGWQLLGRHLAVACAVAIAAATLLMQLLDAVHPPAGGTTLLAILGSARIHDLGYEYVVGPVAAAVVVLLVDAGLRAVRRGSGREFPAYR